MVLIGGGVGITPMMSVVRYLTETAWPGKVYLILGFQAPRDFIFREEIAELQSRNAYLGVTVTTSRPRNESWSGALGRIDAALLSSAVPDLRTQRAHICGPPQMMDAVKAALLGLGLPEAKIKTEAFGTIKRNPAARGAGSTAIAGKVVFQTSDTSAPVPVDTAILDAADEAGVFIDNAYRSGTSGSRRVKLISRTVKLSQIELFGFFGITATELGLLSSLLLFFQKPVVHSEMFVINSTFEFAAIVFGLGGIQLLSLGLLSEILLRTYYKSQKKAIYVANRSGSRTGKRPNLKPGAISKCESAAAAPAFPFQTQR